MAFNEGDAPLRVGDWRVDPISGEISRTVKGVVQTARLEPRTMRLLLYLAERAGEVVSIDELLANVWTGVIVTQDSVYQAVTGLRRLLGDDSKRPTYIATVPRRGYRLLAAVAPWAEPAKAAASPHVAPVRARRRMSPAFAWSAGTTMFLALVLATQVTRRNARVADDAALVAVAPSERSIAVLPFVDLTDGMREEEFADGITEELIGRISRISGVRVPPPTSSFYYKGKQVAVGDIARALNVAYVVDGSVRESQGRVRVAARLVRADDGFVVWSESYERPFTNRLTVQDDIAGEVTRALQSSIDASAGGDAHY
jgi:TolB-like protein/DNA-binding winged helix-turn-helix (wHTH) protein